MNKELGYSKPLYILAFDQRGSFNKKIFNTENLSPEQAQEGRELKGLIYEAFKQAVAKEVPKENGAILVDEFFGEQIQKDAASQGFVTLLTTEKSGQEEFDFEFGQDFGQHLLDIRPTFGKALIRYNPEGDERLNARQREKLKKLSDFCHDNNFKFLIEPLIPATGQQLEKAGGDSKRYDEEIRPGLTVAMIQALQDQGVEVDVWKIEGFESSQNYQKVVAQAQAGGRDKVGVVILGRGAPDEQVNKWLGAGKNVNGVIGFAIGRTIFLQPLMDVKSGAISKEKAVEAMTEKYISFYRTFTS